MKGFAQGIVFLLELVMLASLAFCGYHAAHGKWYGWLLAGLCPALFIILWGTWAAPKARKKLSPRPRLLFRLTLFLIAFGWLAASRHPLVGISLFLLAFLAEWMGETAKS